MKITSAFAGIISLSAFAAPAAAETPDPPPLAARTATLESRMDRVERKLDALLAETGKVVPTTAAYIPPVRVPPRWVVTYPTYVPNYDVAPAVAAYRPFPGTPGAATTPTTSVTVAAGVSTSYPAAGREEPTPTRAGVAGTFGTTRGFFRLSGG